MRLPWLPAAVAAVVLVVAAIFAGLGAGSGPSSTPIPIGHSCAPGPQPPKPPSRSRKIFVSQSSALQATLDRTAPGDTVYLRSGTYSGYFTVSRDGIKGKPIVIRGAPGATAVIQGRLKIVAGSIVVSNLVFDQSGGSAQDVAVYVANGKDNWVAYNEIRHSSYSGILVDGGADRLSVVGNWIHDDGTNTRYDHGIYWSGGVGGLLTQNVIEHNAGYGIQLYPNADGIVVSRNTVDRNGRSGIVVGGNAAQTSDSNLLVRNVIAENSEQGIRTSWDGPVGTGNIARDNVAFGNPGGAAGGDGLTAVGTLDVGATGLYGSQLDVNCVVAGTRNRPN